jgi:coenzyme F420-dependent glucose-6-phosphate dehydrogenase
MSVEFGWKASAEQFGPRELLELSVLAEELGFGTVAVSDHFQPWRHTGGHGPSALVWLGAIGQASANLTLATSVLTPTLRYHPTIVAQAFATLGDLNPGRVILGVGTGEALNEIPATGAEWPSGKERRARLGEAIELIRRLWTEERVTFDGEYYQTRIATIYDRPAEPIPIYMGASGPIAAKMAGRVADGFITTSGKDPALYDQLLGKVEEGAREVGRDFAAMDKMMEIKVSYDHDVEFARKACEWWAALALPGDVKSGVDDPARDGAPGRRRAGPRAHPLHRHGRPAGVRGAHPPLRRARLHPPDLPRPGHGPAALHGPVRRGRAAAAAHGVRRAGAGARVAGGRARPRGGRLPLDEHHHRLGHDPVMRHGVRALLGLQHAHHLVKVGDVHEQAHLRRLLRVDERPDVRDAERPEDLFPLPGGQPMVGVLHIVVGDHRRHVPSSSRRRCGIAASAGRP